MTRPSTIRIAVVVAAVAVVTGLAWALVGPRPTGVRPTGVVEPSPTVTAPAVVPSTRPTVSPTPSEPVAAIPGGTVALEDAPLGLFPGTRYTSRLFEPAITFEINGSLLGRSEWCPPIESSAKLIVFRHARACTGRVRYVSPSAVDCGPAGPRPSADTLAEAMSAGWDDADLGPIATSDLIPSTMFATGVQGRVLLVNPSTSSGRAEHPCRLLSNSGDAGFPIDLHEVSAVVILIDVDDGLVTIIIDGATGVTAHLLEINHDIRFGSAAAATPRATSEPSLPPQAVSIDDSGQMLKPGVVYTSDRFNPRITFEVAITANVQQEWCAPITSSDRSLVFRHNRSCRLEVRYVRPYAVDCGTAGSHPDAAALASALRDGWNDKILGTLQTADLIPDGMFAEAYEGRVVFADAIGNNALSVRRCRLLPAPGSPDPIVDLHAATAFVILVDVKDELIAMTVPYQAATHLLAINHDIRFVPRQRLR